MRSFSCVQGEDVQLLVSLLVYIYKKNLSIFSTTKCMTCIWYQTEVRLICPVPPSVTYIKTITLQLHYSAIEILIHRIQSPLPRKVCIFNYDWNIPCGYFNRNDIFYYPNEGTNEATKTSWRRPYLTVTNFMAVIFLHPQKLNVIFLYTQKL